VEYVLGYGYCHEIAVSSLAIEVDGCRACAWDECLFVVFQEGISGNGGNVPGQWSSN
jgi:hypothetical protein